MASCVEKTWMHIKELRALRLRQLARDFVYHVDPSTTELHTDYRNSSANQLRLKIAISPAPTLHVQVQAVTKREQWQDPDTSSSVSN